MGREPLLFKVAGEYEPFLRGTNAFFSRLGRALVEHGVRLKSSFCIGDGDSILLSLEIPVSKVKVFENNVKCKLTDHPDLQIGMKLARSAKWQDVDGTIYYSPYPDKSDPRRKEP